MNHQQMRELVARTLAMATETGWELSPQHIRDRWLRPADRVLEVLDGAEAGHIIRFGPDNTFNAQHPLHERIGQSLLDCDIHEEVWRWSDQGGPVEGTWRVRPSSEHNLDANWVWEKIS